MSCADGFKACFEQVPGFMPQKWFASIRIQWPVFLMFAGLSQFFESASFRMTIYFCWCQFFKLRHTMAMFLFISTFC